MRTEDLISKLENLDISDIETPNHKSLVRVRLFNLPKRSFVQNLLQGIKQMPALQKFASTMVAVVIIFALFVYNDSNSGQNVTQAQAAETLNKAFTRASKLTPEHRAQIEEKMKADLTTSLEEAKNAKDLTYLTKEEFKKEFSVEMGKRDIMGAKAFGIRFEKLEEMKKADPTQFHEQIEIRHEAIGAPTAGFQGKFMLAPVSDNEVAKYLRYTNDKGATVYLGLDESDTPIFKAIKLETSGDITKDTFIFRGQEIGLPPVDTLQVQ